MSDPLLSSLCTICHIKSHRYRCPRCSTLTCSLPCIKRHKQWAECNGVRDPAAYIKQKDLATPKGIDHDYNYLTSIERELDHAERNATSRGVVLAEDTRSKQSRHAKGELALQAAFERCGVIVARAPKGMSRSKLNATRVTKTRRLRWTVEWVQPDGTKALGICPDEMTLAEAYEAHLNWISPDRPSKRIKPNPQGNMLPPRRSTQSQGLPEQRSRRNSTASHLANISDTDLVSTIYTEETSQVAPISSDQETSVTEDHTLTKAQMRKRRRKGQTERANSTPKTRTELDGEQQLKKWKDAIARKRKAIEMDSEDVLEAANKEKSEAISDGDLKPTPLDSALSNGLESQQTDDISTNLQSNYPNGSTPAFNRNTVDVQHKSPPETSKDHCIPSVTDPRPEQDLSFYLHHPSLPSRHPVLIPLSRTSTLATSLTNRLVLEFPTIYALRQPQGESLPQGFISEDEFYRGAKKELVVELEEGELAERDHGGQREEQHGEGGVDERRLLEVLGRDLKGFGGAL